MSCGKLVDFLVICYCEGTELSPNLQVSEVPSLSGVSQIHLILPWWNHEPFSKVGAGVDLDVTFSHFNFLYSGRSSQGGSENTSGQRINHFTSACLNGDSFLQLCPLKSLFRD